MADEPKTYKPLTAAQFEVLKMYCKVDQTVEDDLLSALLAGASAQIATAVQTGMKPESLLATPETRDRYFSAVMKQVKEEYDQRGESADTMRYPLVDPVSAIVNQLRTEVANNADN